jgi:hypothetical protein
VLPLQPIFKVFLCLSSLFAATATAAAFVHIQCIARALTIATSYAINLLYSPI